MQARSLRAVAGVALIAAVTGCAEANTARARADLALTVRLEDRDRAAAPADSLSFTLEISNNGPADAEDVVVTARLSPDVAYQGSSGAGWICGQATQTVTCERAALASGQVSVLTLTVVGPEEPTNVWSTAEVSSSTADPDDRNNRSEAFFLTAAPTADLWLEKEDSADPIQPGGLFSYTVAIGNAGPHQAAAVVVRDILPAEMQLVSADVSQGTCSDTVCTIGSLPSGARVTVTLTVAAPSLKGVYAHTPRVSSETPDPVNGNNEVLEPVRVGMYRIHVPGIWRGFPPILIKRG
jgi:uncharacterized repeat protein (TIGR01451 family)